jgi:CheY-like chemotaxis protein
MIVDDVMIDRYVASHVIKKNSFSKGTIEFNMTTRALDYLNNDCVKLEAIPQLIFLDINLPAMSGIEFLERLSAIQEVADKTCCVLMLSTPLTLSDQLRVEKASVRTHYIEKPVCRASLENILEFYHHPASVSA